MIWHYDKTLVGATRSVRAIYYSPHAEYLSFTATGDGEGAQKTLVVVWGL